MYYLGEDFTAVPIHGSDGSSQEVMVDSNDRGSDGVHGSRNHKR